MRTRLTNPLGGSFRPAKYEVLPQPANAAATTRAATALIQRLLFFKILYLDRKRGASPSACILMAIRCCQQGVTPEGQNQILPKL